MTRQLGKVSILILMISLFITGCNNNKNEESQSNNSNTDKVVIHFFHRWPNEPRKSFFDKKVAEFEAEHDNVEIKVDSVLNDSYKEKIRVLISNEELPDIFTSWSDTFAENIVSSEKVKSLNDLYESDKEWSDKILNSQIGAFTFNNKIYGVPLTIDGKVFFYNKDIFKDNNLNVPKDFDELLLVLDKLKEAGFESPIIEGLTDPWTISHYEGTIFQRILDPTILAQDFNLTGGKYDDPGYIKGLTALKELFDRMGETASAIDHETARNMFASGQVPVMYMQLAEIKMVEDAGDIDFGFFDFPIFKDGRGDSKALTGAPEGFMLSKDAPKEAEEFLKFLTSEESAFEFTKECGQLNAIKGSVNEENASKRSLESYEIILNSSNTVPWFDNAVNINIADIFMRGGQGLATGDESPESIMEKVRAEAQNN